MRAIIAAAALLAALLLLPAAMSHGAPPAEMNEADGTELLLVPEGEFLIGSRPYEGEEDEHPCRRMSLPAFYIGKHEITNGQFRRFTVEAGYAAVGEWRKYAKSGRDAHPVVNVTYFDAAAYCDWAGLRLPTEAEWEKAARGADGRVYPWGDAWDRTLCNSCELPEGASGASRASIYRGLGTTAVGSFAGGASPSGCLDMAGNVEEWVADWYAPFPGSTLRHTPPRETYRVMKGGSWGHGASMARCADRVRNYPHSRYMDVGFRAAKDVTSSGR